MKRKTRTDFQALADLRADEAGVLARNGKEAGAYYLGGLAIECALKACIAKKTRAHEFPNKDYASSVYTHDLAELLKLAKLGRQLDRDSKTNSDLARYWGVVRGWKVGSRYTTSGLKGTDMHAAVKGVVSWIKLRW